jgi:hypothetical protein
VGTQSLGILGSENVVPTQSMCFSQELVRFGNRLHRATPGFLFFGSLNFGVAPPSRKLEKTAIYAG